MAMTRAVELGNVLITRIPPGGRVLPHVDRGWAPEFYTSKFYVVLHGNAETVNLCGEGADEEQVVMAPGSIWAFENRITHSVENNGASERISLIVTLRVEP
jgi:mannose-6-phosphate isomerase-like protein (cupin superfamily)